MIYELVATATFGLEAVVKRELEALAFRVLKTEDGKITYEGDEAAIAKSNLWLRSADRVYIKAAEFNAETFEELYQNMKGIPWENFFPMDANVVVVGTSVKSTLHSVPACQSICKKAIVDRMCDFYVMDSMAETGAKYTVRFAFQKNRALILLDTSGEGLHKRGYRVANVDAPIKETLAAALVQLSFWKSGRILVDPCCGSGTLGIEAALIGLNIAPGLGRSFASEEWDLIGKEVWKNQRREAYEKIDTETQLNITCGDIDAKAVLAAKKNAEEAGVEDQIHFVVGDMKALAGFSGKREEGIILCNPPYGERIGDKEAIEKVYSALRSFMSDNPTWSLFMITSDKDAEEKVLGREANRRRKLYNGMIETCYYQFHGKRPGK